MNDFLIVYLILISLGSLYLIIKFMMKKKQ